MFSTGWLKSSFPIVKLIWFIALCRQGQNNFFPLSCSSPSCNDGFGLWWFFPIIWMNSGCFSSDRLAVHLRFSTVFVLFFPIWWIYLHTFLSPAIWFSLEEFDFRSSLITNYLLKSETSSLREYKRALERFLLSLPLSFSTWSFDNDDYNCISRKMVVHILFDRI